ncbi:hypothetical protein B0H63DRAFT_520835 [Podospora didyma]|uniref:Uncharacterized protein n=1 Tax=Podospora didyma TaxID=330526 RepID=A0AAE0NSB3_9PEZI|nr:hypothetical protein B0H63DRAFT_520835 [Podospora didyma]
MGGMKESVMKSLLLAWALADMENRHVDAIKYRQRLISLAKALRHDREVQMSDVDDWVVINGPHVRSRVSNDSFENEDFGALLL